MKETKKHIGRGFSFCFRARSCRQVTIKYFGLIILYTVILLVLLLLQDTYNEGRHKSKELEVLEKKEIFSPKNIQTKRSRNGLKMEDIEKLSSKRNGFTQYAERDYIFSNFTRNRYNSELDYSVTSSHFKRLSQEKKENVLNRVQNWFTIKNESSKDSLLNKHEYALHHSSNICHRKIDILILVHSLIDNFEQREKIRSTWGSINRYRNASIAVVFMLGESLDINKSLKLVKEAFRFGDIVQGNFMDTYRNLTYKHVMALHWVTSYCNDVRTVVKVDDDVMVNIFKLVSFSNQFGHFHNSIYCSPFYQGIAIRDKRDKWYTPYEIYPFDIYPDYCEGLAYIMSADEAKHLYRASKDMRFYWVDDVYVTGILARKAGIGIAPFTQEHTYVKWNSATNLPGNTFMFFLDFKDWKDIWKKIQLTKT